MRSKNQLRIIDLKASDIREEISKLRSREAIPSKVDKTVRRIIKDVETSGDEALLDYTLKLDGAELTQKTLRTSPREIEEAYGRASKEQVSALKFAKRRIERFERAVMKSVTHITTKENGVKINRRIMPIKSVGCYVPGGRAVYPSSLLMTVIPAKVAGVERIVVTSPPSKEGVIPPLLLVAADICGVDEFYKVGGAQAVAALAYGTESVKPVDKIVGPGNIYVTAAKLAVSGAVGIDLPAGPSELLIMADASADAGFVARDMVSQAEHGYDSVCGLVTDSPELSRKVTDLLSGYMKGVARRDIVSDSLNRYGFIALCKDLDQMVEFANLFAAEHLEIMVTDPRSVADNITSAGLILLGPYSPSAASDYCVGTNHVLPTGGYARTGSGLSSLAFVKQMDVVECSKAGLERLRRPAAVLASSEGLVNHASALEERFRADAV
ncbi:MAG: histidinol dehydrogenase [Nitrososphaerales archaeon]